MKYQNQRPDLVDQIKTLVQSANSVKTVPHGIKTVNPGEGLQLLSSDGSEIFWDWETAREYDDRIASGQAAIAEAEAALAQTRLDLDAAGERITDARLEIAGAVTQAAEAKQLVETTASTLAGVDTRLTATAGELSTLKTTVGDVSAAVTASEKKASDALAKSVQAQASADGKNRITRSTSPASGAGTAVGDTHFVMSSMGGGGRVVRQQRWDGSTWQDETVSHEVIASLDLGKATVGELDGGRIAAGSLYADRIVSGVSQNMVPDPGFVNASLNALRISRAFTFGDRWYISDGVLYNSPLPEGRTNPSNISMAVTSDLFSWPAYPSMKLSVSCQARATGGEASFRWNIRLRHRDGSTQYSQMRPANYQPLTSAWQTFAFEYDMPETVVGYSVVFQISAIGSSATIAMKSPLAASKTGSVLIENGAVTAEKVDAQSVAAAVGQFVKVQAANVEVTESLAARVVNAMTANLKNLVVTESAILQHSTLLGTTVAERLNVTKLLVGRDAILTGTVDVAQLNVTEAMSAEIVRSMTTETKKLVVTEDAILNNATVITSLVTPELIADKANVQTLAARMVSAGAIVAQDSTGSVQINPSGITVRDAAPGSSSYTRQVQITPSGITGGTRTTPTVNIDGRNNWMIGEFATAPDKQRVRIRSTSSVAAVDLFASNATQDHVGIWYDSPDSNVLNAVGRVIAMTGVQHTDDSPGMLMWPMRGTFGFQGRWQQDSVATKFVVMTNYAGLGPGAYNQITIPYQSPFRTNNSLRCPFVSVESATGADVMATIVEQTASNIKVNIINQSGGKASGAIVLRIVTFNINA